jgi:serine/threonine protein kinase
MFAESYEECTNNFGIEEEETLVRNKATKELFSLLHIRHSSTEILVDSIFPEPCFINVYKQYNFANLYKLVVDRKDRDVTLLDIKPISNSNIIATIARELLLISEELNKRREHEVLTTSTLFLSPNGKIRTYHPRITELYHRSAFVSPFVAFMSPESIRNEDIYPPSDRDRVWSIGVILVHLMNAKTHYDGLDVSEMHPMRKLFIVGKCKKVEIADNGEHPQELIDFVNLCFALDDKNNRRKSAAELLEHYLLRRALPTSSLRWLHDCTKYEKPLKILDDSLYNNKHFLDTSFIIN